MLLIAAVPMAALVPSMLGGAPTSVAAAAGPTTYMVRNGDTLGQIAAATGASIQRLAALNGLQDPNRIEAGQTLRLSTDAASKSSATAGQADGSYQVRPGDSLFTVAARFGTTPDALVQLNALADPDRIVVGQTLKLPAPTTVAATSSATVAPDPLQKAVAEARRIGGPNLHIGIAALNRLTGQRIAYHADDVFPSASVLKLGILAELERQVAAGQLSWTPALRQQAEAMIVVSDNDAANHLFDLLGPDAINRSLANWGLSSTKLVHHFSDTGAGATTPGNRTTAADMLRLVDLVASGQLVSPYASTDMRGLMARNQDGSKLARPLPSGTIVAHKSGWFDGLSNDVGIVTAGKSSWDIAVFAQGVPDAETGNQVVAAVSKAVYDAWSKS